MNNYKVYLSMRIVKTILNGFIDSFFVLYFLDVSHSNILPLGIYKLIAISAIYAVMFFSRNFCTSKKRINLTRTGIILNLLYFLAIIILRENVTKYMYIVGLLYGLGEGFYFSVYNNIESDGIKNEERAKYLGTYRALSAIISIIYPLVFGGIIYETGFIKSLLILMVMVVALIVLSFMIKDHNVPKKAKTDLRAYANIAKKNEVIKKSYIVQFFDGLTYSEGAFSYIVTIYIIKVFSNSVSLGIFTSIFSLITALLGILFAKCIKPKHYASIIKVSTVFTVISLCLMIYKCNMITIILFNLFKTFSRELMDLINLKNKTNTSNLSIIQKEYKVEYWFGVETALFIGRLISNSLFILMAFTGAGVMIYIFAIFLILFARALINLQKTVECNKENVEI
ncbi:MAG: MFS transporter [Clostridia bacterium]